MVRCRKQHKGKEKVVRARGKPMHRARTAWCTGRTALISPSKHKPAPRPKATQAWPQRAAHNEFRMVYHRKEAFMSESVEQ